MDGRERRPLLTRRRALALGVVVTAIASARPARAQTIGLPPLSETSALLQSIEGVLLIEVRFSLALSLARDQVVRAADGGTANLTPLNELPLFSTDPNALFEPLRRMRNGDLREIASSALSDLGDPLEGGRGVATERLLANLADRFRASDIAPGAPPIADALGACAHVERIAIVTPGLQAGPLFLCRYFPFSYFCS